MDTRSEVYLGLIIIEAILALVIWLKKKSVGPQSFWALLFVGILASILTLAVGILVWNPAPWLLGLLFLSFSLGGLIYLVTYELIFREFSGLSLNPSDVPAFWAALPLGLALVLSYYLI